MQHPVANLRESHRWRAANTKPPFGQDGSALPHVAELGRSPVTISTRPFCGSQPLWQPVRAFATENMHDIAFIIIFKSIYPENFLTKAHL